MTNVLEVEIPDNVVEISQPDSKGVNTFYTRNDVKGERYESV